ncbi:conserved hypothetical protein [Chlamydia pneumoniae LPCoLN]|uniref:DUF648 domain-containing protein n=1 Tax=Chlamydia pneumoniae TaxID=83558 RepID=UPI0001BD9D3E|nr:DUF648 domain-containing protein [Chlamydia pneumoniae]ACZ33151.1 conserved hypothetical protein [Chlamydia pneumoniae LPCoLN]ETR80044.1 hypothetical protein X556_0621 [Chlamydia pneumoniae B21]
MLSFFPSISLSRPYQAFNSGTCTLERLAATVDSYFDLGQSQIVFMSKQRNRVISYQTWNSAFRVFKPGSLERTLKIISYLLIIPLVIALIFKCVLRLALHMKYRFEDYVPSDGEIIDAVGDIVHDIEKGIKGAAKSLLSTVSSLGKPSGKPKPKPPKPPKPKPPKPKPPKPDSSRFTRIPGVKNGYGFRT